MHNFRYYLFIVTKTSSYEESEEYTNIVVEARFICKFRKNPIISRCCKYYMVWNEYNNGEVDYNVDYETEDNITNISTCKTIKGICYVDVRTVYDYYKNNLEINNMLITTPKIKITRDNKIIHLK